MSKLSASTLRRAFAQPRLLLATALILVGAAMALYATTPREQSRNAATAQPAQKSKHTNNIYIVQLQGAPVATYRGELPNLAATAPAQGQ